MSCTYLTFGSPIGMMNPFPSSSASMPTGYQYTKASVEIKALSEFCGTFWNTLHVQIEECVYVCVGGGEVGGWVGVHGCVWVCVVCGCVHAVCMCVCMCMCVWPYLVLDHHSWIHGWRLSCYPSQTAVHWPHERVLGGHPWKPVLAMGSRQWTSCSPFDQPVHTTYMHTHEFKSCNNDKLPILPNDTGKCLSTTTLCIL